jgi:hypothetical protein
MTLVKAADVLLTFTPGFTRAEQLLTASKAVDFVSAVNA